MNQLKYVTYIDTTTGRISRISIPQYNIDDEGLREDGTLIVHVREDNLPEGCEDLRYFMDNHWYNTESNEFIFIGLPPNRHAFWSLEKNWWDWDIELVMEDVRIARNRLLSECDWTQQPDVALSESKLQAWRTYRQELRDITQTMSPTILSVYDVVWPEKPL